MNLLSSMIRLGLLNLLKNFIAIFVHKINSYFKRRISIEVSLADLYILKEIHF